MTNQLEPDYQPTFSSTGPTQFLPGTRIEIIRRPRLASPPEHVLFDFDGTLSLIREGWPDVMIPMMVEVLRETGTNESEQSLRELVERFVMELNGKQTIYQMLRLAEEVTRRGGEPKPAAEYKHQYHEMLMRRIRGRREQLRDRRLPAEAMLVPGGKVLLDELRNRGVTVYLASGTDENYVREEVELLGLHVYFGQHVYGAVDDYKSFSKAQVIERILTTNQLDPSRLLGFGDGYVEIENVKAAGGTAVAVASDEKHRGGEPDPWKRERLIGVGADIVIPDFQEHRPLLDYLWNVH